MKGGTIVDATILNAPPSTKNVTGNRDPEMYQKSWGTSGYFGMKCHMGVDAQTGPGKASIIQGINAPFLRVSQEWVVNNSTG
jgi:IS5 family transposase